MGRSLTSAGSLLRTFLETTPDIVLFKDADSRYLAVSRSFYRERHALMSESEAIGKSDLDFYPTEFGEETHAARRRCRHGRADRADDISAFVDKMLEEFTEGKHAEQHGATQATG